MKLRCAALFALSFAALCLPFSVRAEDAPPEPDPDLPQPFDPAAYLPMLQNPPFTRVVDYTDSLMLTGVAYLDGKPMATLFDRNTKKRYVVSDEPNAQGWRLTEANVSSGLHGTEIKLQVGVETITIHYSESQINPVNKNGKTTGVSGASPGAGASSATALLKPEDRDFLSKRMSKEAREKFGGLMDKLQSKMSKMTDEQRAAYAQKYFDKYKAQDQAGQNGSPPPTKSAPSSSGTSKKNRR